MLIANIEDGNIVIGYCRNLFPNTPLPISLNGKTDIFTFRCDDTNTYGANY